MTVFLLSPLMALMAPFLVLIIETVFPYPHIVEELVKALLVWQVLTINNKKQQLKLTVSLGILFALSETVLYLMNFFLLSSPTPLLSRLVLTSTLHAVTMLVMLLSSFINKRFFIVGLILAMLIHYSYNLLFL